MEPLISSVAAFIAYFESIRRRTLQFVAQVPPERMDWAPRAGEFTCGDIVRHLAAGHAAALDRLRTLPDAALAEHRPSLDGPPIRAWRLLMAMVEHEIHHRSQLAMYLMLLGVQPPHIYGLGVEDVIARATG